MDDAREEEPSRAIGGVGLARSYCERFIIWISLLMHLDLDPEELGNGDRWVPSTENDQDTEEIGETRSLLRKIALDEKEYAGKPVSRKQAFKDEEDDQSDSEDEQDLDKMFLGGGDSSDSENQMASDDDDQVPRPKFSMRDEDEEEGDDEEGVDEDEGAYGHDEDEVEVEDEGEDVSEAITAISDEVDDLTITKQKDSAEATYEQAKHASNQHVISTLR